MKQIHEWTVELLGTTLMRDTPASRSLVNKICKEHKPGEIIFVTTEEWQSLADSIIIPQVKNDPTA